LSTLKKEKALESAALLRAAVKANEQELELAVASLKHAKSTAEAFSLLGSSSRAFIKQSFEEYPRLPTLPPPAVPRLVQKSANLGFN